VRSLIGFLVPPPYWSARIVGVYSRAISLLHADGALVSLVRGEEDMEARAIALAGHWEPFRLRAAQAFEEAGEKRLAIVDYRGQGGTGGEQLLRLSLRAGAQDNGLDEGSTAEDSGKHGYVVALYGAEPWDPRDGLRRCCSAENMTKEGLNAAIVSSRAQLKTFLSQTRFEASARDGIGGKGPFATAFARLKERDDYPACLVGFGPGTTPAGDDWLTGFLAAADLRALAAGPDGAAAESGGPPSDSRTPRIDTATLRAAIGVGLSRTNAAGRSLLLGALAGAPPAYLLRVRRACLSRQADGGAALSQAMADASGHGASSGRDSLEGFLAGFEGIQDFSPRE
jgi:hypothetical protein